MGVHPIIEGVTLKEEIIHAYTTDDNRCTFDHIQQLILASDSRDHKKRVLEDIVRIYDDYRKTGWENKVDFTAKLRTTDPPEAKRLYHKIKQYISDGDEGNAPFNKEDIELAINAVIRYCIK